MLSKKNTYYKYFKEPFETVPGHLLKFVPGVSFSQFSNSN